jgi:uncharacterized protein
MPVTVNIRHLEEDSKHLAGEASPEDLGVVELADELVHVREPLKYDVEVQKGPDNLLVTGKLDIDLDCECARCLKAFKFPVRLDPYNAFVPLDGEDAAPVVNDLVDLGPIFREDTLLAFPQHPLCSEDCAGLANASGSKDSKPDKSSQGNESASAWAKLDKLKF